MDSISLDQLCAKYWGVQDLGAIPDGVKVVDVIREREDKLKARFPGWLVRRLDVGMARSNPVHPHTGRALYTICRAMHAKTVFETGTYWGYSTAYLAAALQDMGAGRIWTFDIYPEAGSHIPRSLLNRIELLRGKPSVEAMPEILDKVKPDLFFQDSRHDYEGVAEELRMIAPHLEANAVVLLHDFVDPAVRNATQDVLKGYDIYQLEGEDPQQLGIAVRSVAALQPERE